jgi:cytochrome oxidase Cu insertion factor (SCO1/SenC/PrrC family)
MSDDRKKTLIGSFVAAILSLCGCGHPGAPPKQVVPKPTVIEEVSVSGFDQDGEPVIKKWSDGSIWIHFEAMPPFFAEDEGTEADFEKFETKVQEALGVPVRRDDREVFIIADPKPDTAQKAKEWLEAYRKQGG